jgi:plasmid maintenance system killer protein
LEFDFGHKPINRSHNRLSMANGSSAAPPDHVSLAVLPLQMRPETHVLHDLAALPGNRFEALKGDRKGQYSIRINDQWRICFGWPDGSPGPTNVAIVDYH